MRRMSFEHKPDVFELEDKTYNWDNIEFDNVSHYGLYEDISYNELMKNFEEELEV